MDKDLVDDGQQTNGKGDAILLLGFILAIVLFFAFIIR